MKFEVDVKNAEKATEKYIVVREYEGELWFWGEWQDRRYAEITAKEIGGIVVENPNKE